MCLSFESDIRNLIDITTSTDVLYCARVYTMAPGVKEEDLTEHEKQLLEFSKEYLKWKDSRGE